MKKHSPLIYHVRFIAKTLIAQILPMRFYRVLALLAVFALAAAPIPAMAGESAAISDRGFLSQYVQTLYDEDSHIPVSEVKSIMQTSDAFLWVAGYQGLMRFNGSEAKTFMPEDGFPSFKINILYEDSINRLWIGTNDSGLAVFDDNKFTVYGNEHGMPSASVRGITEDENGYIYIAATGGIAIISPDGALSLHPELGDVFAIQIEYMGGGRLISLLNDGSIVIFDGQGIIESFDPTHLGEAQPYSIYMSKSGRLYIGTIENYIYISDANLSSYDTVATGSLQTHNSFYEDSAGLIWAAADNGVGYFTDGVFYPVGGLVMSNRIECVFEDYEGNYWLGSSRSGLLRLTRAKFTNIGFLADLPAAVVNTTAVMGGDLYIGTDSGLIILRDNTPIQNDLTVMLDGIRIRSIYIDSNGRMWISTFERHGVVLYERDGSITSINEEKGLASNRARCVMEAADGGIYVGMSGGVSLIRDGLVVKNYTKDDGLSNDVILSLAEGENGTIYAGSDGGGIYAINGDVIINYSEADGLASDIILRMTAIGGGIWISTGNAICYMDDTGIREIEKMALYDDSVFDIIDIDGNIWFVRTRGISICDNYNLLSEDDLIVRHISRRDGLSSPVTANSWNALGDDGLLYVSTSTGVFSVDTQALSLSGSIPVAAVVGVVADGAQVFGEGGTVTLTSDIQRMDLHIALLSFASEDGTLSYMLDGFDNDYNTGKRSDISLISYTNLPGGTYTFYLYGANGDGVLSDMVSLLIVKEYALLEIPFVRAVLILSGFFVLVAFIWFLITQRTKTIARQRQEYKNIADQFISLAADISDSKEKYMAGHSRRVADYSKKIGKLLGMEENELETLYYAALLHDVGKAGIPDEVFNKTGKLTDEEYELIKGHVKIGGSLLNNISIVGDISVGARYHHERVDGRGYCEGLSGDEIPLTAKIICVCNAFDSMLSDQAYRKALKLEKAQAELMEGVGKQFDKIVTAALISLIREGKVPV